MNIATLRKQTGQEEIDYLLLKSLLSDIACPRDKITRLLKMGALIRVKKGLYIFGEEASQRPFSKERLANLIYGPSAISLEYALSFYGLIPESTFTITSITNKRNKHFSTPVGEFSYRYLSFKKYAIGLTRLSLQADQHILIATPEKALADLLLHSPLQKEISTRQQVEHYLLEDLRLDESRLKTFNLSLLEHIAIAYRSPLVHLLLGYLR